MTAICALCKHAGRIVGYHKNIRGGRMMILYCAKYKRTVRQDEVCWNYESERGKRLP